MIWLKEFLKPNRWKVCILFLLFILLGIFIVNCSFVFLTNHDPSCGILAYFLLPINYLLYFLGIDLEDLGGLNFVIMFLYWYLLSCLIYFIFSKIKHLLTKKA